MSQENTDKRIKKWKGAEASLRAAEASGNVDKITAAKRSFVRASRAVRDHYGPHMLSASVLTMIAE